MCRFQAILLIAFLPIVIAIVEIVKRDVMNICVHEIDVESRAYTTCGYGNIDKYHCLMTQNGGYIEICADPIEIPAGKYPLFSTATKTIYAEECDPEKYQPIAKMSNKFYQQRCEKEKSVCDMDGEIICTDGGTTADRQCACNYTADYIAYAYQFFNPEAQTCYTSSLQISGCFLDKCKDDREELNPAYQCVPKCPDGYHRPFWKFDCSRKAGLPETTALQKSTTTEAPTTTPEPTPVIHTDIQPMPVNPNSKSDIEKHAINTTIIAFFILCLMAVLIIVMRFSSKYCMDVIVPQISYPFHYEDMVKLECEIRSIFPMCLLRLRWRREDKEETLDKYIDDKKYSGGNTKEPTLTIQSAHESDEGTYICTLSSVVPFLLSKEARVMLYMPGASPQIPKKHSKATPETPAKHLQVPSIYDDFRHMDSTDNESGLDSKRHTGIIYIENYIASAKNLNIGHNSKIIDKEGYKDSSETDVGPPPKRKDKKKARRPRRPLRIPVSSEDSSDEYTEKDKLLNPKRRPSGPVHLSYEDENAKYVKPKAYPPTRLLDTQKKIDKLCRTKYGKYVHDVLGDGHCLYHAFILLLRTCYPGGYQDLTVPQLRKKLVKFLESNPTTPGGCSYKDFLSSPQDAGDPIVGPEDKAIETDVPSSSDQKQLRWQRFLERVQNDKWGDSIEIQGLSQLFNVPVTVAKLNSKGDDIDLEHFHCGDDQSEETLIWLAHISSGGKGIHFVALLPLDEDESRTPHPSKVTNKISDESASETRNDDDAYDTHKDTSASEALKDTRTLETHKDACTSETHKDASEASGEDFEGADLRKEHDNAETYDLLKKFILADSNESIGLIKAKVDGKTNGGTGFRAGSKYIITAYHVVEPLIINLWISLFQQVIQYINKNESSQKENWRKVEELFNIQMPIDKAEKRLAKRKELENLLSESGHRRISDLADRVASMNLPNLSREMVLKRGKENFSDNCVIIFDYRKDKETHSKFHISADIPYASKLEDVIVLALDVDGLTKELPKRFLLDFKGCDEGVDKMHIVGYPKSGELIVDPSCDIIHDEMILEETKAKAIKFFRKLNLSEDTKHKMEGEFSNCKIGGLKILFHCSKSITGGASGAPGIAQHDRVTKVLAMMQKGCPSLYYNDELSAEDSKKVKPKYLIEKGIAMARLRELMLESGDAEVRKLKDDLFNEELDDRKVIACKGDQQESPEQRGDILKEFKRSFQPCLHRAYLGVQKDDKKEVIVAITKQEGDSPPLIPAEFRGLSVINKNIHSYREGSKVQREMAWSEMNQTYFDKTAEVIQKHSERLMKKYSNLEIVSTSSVKFSSGNTKAEYQVCIVLYCTAKGIIPKDEEEFPKEIEGYPVDVREGIFLLYMYPASLFARGGFMQQDYIANLRMGCNIGVRGKNVCGSLGGFVEVENVGTCFLTCAHVIHDISTAIQNKQQIWTDSHLDVTQPADSVANGAEGERKCGEHLESVFDNVGDCTVDAALIKVVGERSPVGGDFEPIYPADVRMLDFDSAPQYTSGETSVPKENRKVIKVGAASGLTRGIVSSKSSSVRIRCGDLEYFASGLYQITPDTPSVFGDMGDSGSFIFTFNGYGVGDKQLQCIGMLIGGTTHAENPHVYVTPIGPILSAFKNHKIKGLKVFAPQT